MNKNAIYWSVFFVILALVGGGLYYEYKNTRPCAHPISYSIGAIDPRFSITKSTLINDAEAAAAIWNKAAGRTVLSYDSTATLKINLIYDAREASAKLGNEIALQQATEDTERSALDALQAQFVQAQAAYNQAVRAVNVRGGATRSEATALAEQRKSLNTLANSLESKVASYNAGVTTLNAAIQQYNQSVGHTFEEGEYIQDASGERINIFEFIGDTQLERVLAHEFGHAIGLGHNSDPKSIMYAKNESGNLIPTTADLAALQVICGT